MHIIAVGLNYRTAPVEIREKFAFSEQDLPIALTELKETKSILECVIVATCNRTEFYAVVDRAQMCSHYLTHFIERWFQVPKDQFQKHLYMYENEKAVEHLFRVTSGLDSMVIGETQILGQVRDAFLSSQKMKATGSYFNTLFKQSITLAKKAHSETGISNNPVSVSYAAVELGKRIFGSYMNKTVMIIGAGKMSELTVKHLYANGANKVIVVNRTFERAAELAAKFNGVPSTIEDMPKHLPEVDIIISSTGAPGYVLTKSNIQSYVQKRKSRPLFMMDIAVPRDLDPQISELPNVFLYDIDDLEHIVDKHLQERKKEAAKIETMIGSEIGVFEQWTRTLGVSPVINALQTKASQIHEETMESMLKKLPDLDEREIKVIRKLTKSIVNQVLRDPILRIKEMAGERHGDEALELFTKLFALEETLEQQEEADQLAQAQEAGNKALEAKQLLEDKLSVRGLQAADVLAKT
ncbi:glutamyl-tRNA reductase [Paenibacillus sp. GCM10023248]|uniref:glutamyl-tRNA reductase n=1 Tax=Bacillales TaxID=1385 RepID=UPI002379E706|nr:MULTISPECIES: glutamyl-tRNA reductase [Bacillales]MDD9269888.1 glutamyl-tRNA reductase [Paenibacillus sp. MAHUQ-63]MDR6884925.1 glutamyl-tRNA reductase [Bacillus sp. 3255]